MKQKSFHGISILVEMFRHLDPHSRLVLYKKLEEASPIIKALVEKCEFMYQDLSRLDEKSIQRLLYKIEFDDLVLAWKLTDDKLRDYVIKNLSKLRVEELDLRLKEVGSVPKLRVYKAQSEIAKQAYLLLMQGQISLASRKYGKS